MTSDDRNLVRRLLEHADEPAAEAEPSPARAAPGSSAPGSSSAPDLSPDPEPPGATFIVRDGWDGAATTASRQSQPSPDLRSRLRAAMADPMSPLSRTLRISLWVLAGLGALIGVSLLWAHATTDPIADAKAYYDAAVRLNHGRPLYPAGANPDVAEFYRYPPLLAIVARPFAAVLSYQAFALLWEALVVASFVALVWRLGGRSSRTWIALGILAGPIAWAVAVGQAQVPTTLLLAIGQPWSIALAANLKVFPALAALWWVGRRDWQALFAFLLYLVLFGLAQLVLDPSGTLAYVQDARLGWVGQVTNLSPYAISPELWAALVAIGVAAAVVLARSRAGWAVAVALATLSQPRLLLYMFTSLLAAVREPRQANLPQPEPRPWQHVTGSGRH